ncbi:reverse transcriptase domain-containing protein, partial [Enterobacter cloacae complex sp. 4DZ3-17B2]|uniref:reverse transcriptase domain-containing protein n=1 Tax=Enterobacter cloacae complex sp. 4DZ3-17B2 TaxID=2511990 RepID=UPI0027D3299E
MTNAFGSVPHAAIAEALRQHGVPGRTRNIILASGQGATTRVRTAQGETGPIRISSGVRQGCPLSPIVFNLTLEPVLRSLATLGSGYMLWGRSINNLTYADDTVLLTSTQEEMEAQLRTVQEAAGSVGLLFNPAKCATLHIGGGRNAGVRPTTFSLQNGVVKSLGVSEVYDDLGIPTWFQVRQT